MNTIQFIVQIGLVIFLICVQIWNHRRNKEKKRLRKLDGLDW